MGALLKYSVFKRVVDLVSIDKCENERRKTSVFESTAGTE
jgi:hypothetical protein